MGQGNNTDDHCVNEDKVQRLARILNTKQKVKKVRTMEMKNGIGRKENTHCQDSGRCKSEGG